MMTTPELIQELVRLEERIARLETLQFQAGGGGGAMVLLKTATLAGSAASIGVSGIPSGYRNLFWILVANTDRAAFWNDHVLLQLNGDTTAANYYSAESANIGICSTSGAIAGMYAHRALSATRYESLDRSSSFGYVANYDQSDLEKTILAFGGTGQGLSAGVEGLTQHDIGHWFSTAVVTSMDFVPLVGSNIIAGARLWVYGMGT
jgi:hypothetical protein